MSKRFTSFRILAMLVTLSLLATPAAAGAQLSPIDDLIKRATDAFNDLQYARADSIARQVLSISTINATQRTRAQFVIVAAAYPEEATAQHRDVALSALKLMVRSNFNLKMPTELSWPGLDALVEEAKRQTFVLDVSVDGPQTAVGPDGSAKLKMQSNRSASFKVVIVPLAGGPAAVVDSAGPAPSGEITFHTMRSEKPVFATGAYSVIVTGYDPVAKDSVTVQRTFRADAPPLTFVPVPTRMDSTKLLKERAGRMGAKAVLPAIIVGGAAFALSSVLRGEGDISKSVAADSKGIAIGGAMAVSTILAGFRDRGRFIPANIAANRATGDAFQKSIVDAQAENRKRLAEHRTVLTLEEAR